MSAIPESLAGNPGALLPPEKKNEFGIGGGAISACIEGSLAFFSLFLVDILSRSEFLRTHPTVFLCKSRKILSSSRSFKVIDLVQGRRT